MASGEPQPGWNAQQPALPQGAWNAQPGVIPDQVQGPIVVRTYKAKMQADAAAIFQADAGQMAAASYYPVSQSWAPGS